MSNELTFYLNTIIYYLWDWYNNWKTKILLYFKDIIKIDHLVLKELGGVLIKEHNKDLERYSLERKLSNRIITGFENSLTDAFYNKLELSRMKILELLSHEEINKNDNHILVLGAMIKILQIIQALNFEKNQSRLAIIIKDILKERNLTKITIKKILLNKLSFYKRIIGHEIVEILLKTTCIEQYSFNIKNKRKIFIKILIPTILVNLATDLPNLIENHKPNKMGVYSHLGKEFEVNDKHQFKYDSFSKGITSKKKKRRIKISI